LLQTPNCWGQANPDQTCGEGKEPGTLALANAIRDTISEAQEWVDITTLAICEPTYSVVADGIFHEKIVEGMKRALDHSPNCTFRILAGAPPVVTNGLAQNYMNELQKGLGEKYFATARIYVTSSASEKLESWNHAKIVAADAKRSVVGGHNLWSYDYFGPAPVTDVSMTLRGPAVASAHSFADLLWLDVCDVEEHEFGFHMVRSPAAVAAGKLNPALVCPRSAVYGAAATGSATGPTTGASAAAATGEGVDVLALGQLGVSIPPPGGAAGPPLCGANPGHRIPGVSCGPTVVPGSDIYYTDFVNDGGDWPKSSVYSVSNPQEEGLRALLASARTSITLAQQDILFGSGSQAFMCAGVPHGAHYDLRLVDTLVFKMAAENVSVSLVISTPAGVGGYSNIGNMTDVSDVFVSRLVAGGYSSSVAAAKALLCSRMRLGALRLSKGFEHWADGTSNRLHSKVLLVDRAAFYIGSKNVYPALLQEFGYMIQDGASARAFEEQFFAPLLQYADIWIDPAAFPEAVCRI
jgi:phosphatidylserine/phosphatidylglycerophosphate/cardiolipin synthase-like enzyme